MKERPQKKQKFVMPYKKIMVNGRENGRIYLVGKSGWDSYRYRLGVIITTEFVSDKKDLFSLALANEGFLLTAGETFEDFLGVRNVIYGSLKQLCPKESDIMGFMEDIAGRMGKKFEEWLKKF